MGWRDRTVTCAGSVLFRGRMPPRLQEFAPALKAAGGAAEPAPADGDLGVADLRHPQWGAARAVCLRDAPTPSAALVDFAPNLGAAERAAAKAAGSSVGVALEGGRGDVLRDRKSLLRFLRALMGDDGLVAVDHTAQRFWPRAALDDELAHDADLDVEAIFATHAVSDDPPDGDAPDGDAGGDEPDRPTKWLHTHGLAEVGFFDFDVLAPHESVVSQGGVDALRVMAFDILEGAARPGADRHPLAGGPNGAVRLVDVAAFNRRAAPRDVALRLGADDDHNVDRVVLCDPPGGLLGRWFGRPRPCGWLQREVGDGDLLLLFSDAATELMAGRARATWPRFRAFAAELAEFEFPTIAKIGYETDAGGNGGRREHLWFEVHEARDASADATLQSEPFDIAGMRAGDRGEHPLERLTDWSIITPAGMITPRSTAPLRRIREHKDQLREMVRAGRE